MRLNALLYLCVLSRRKMMIYRRAKRIIGLLISILLLILIIPICLIACFFIVIESSGNPIYMQERVGLNGQKFIMYKLRSMYLDAEKNGYQWAEKNDPRIRRLDVLYAELELMNFHKLLILLKARCLLSVLDQKDQNLLTNF